MSERRDIEPAEAAQITRDIHETFGFLEDLIRDPFPLRYIPTGSTLQFRTVRIGPHRFRLTAYRPRESDGEWSCRVTTHVRISSDRTRGRSQHPLGRRQSREQQMFMPRTHRTVRPLGGQLVVRAGTADRAFDLLELELRRRVESRVAARACG